MKISAKLIGGICCSLFSTFCPAIADNGFGLCDVVAFKAQKFNNPPKLNRITKDDVI